MWRAIVMTFALIVMSNTASSALAAPGATFSWGYNAYGQLGDGSTKDSSVPGAITIANPKDNGTAALAAGGFHSLALRKDGTVWAWGYNGNGQLGNGCIVGVDCVNSTTPVQVKLSPNGPPLRGVVAIAAGFWHSMAVTSSGQLYVWGDNTYGQLGDGTHTSRGSTGAPPFALGSGIRAIAAGWLHSLAVLNDGSVWAWGYNSNGQLGNGSSASTASPVKVLNGGITKVAAGGYHSLALNLSGMVLAWGHNADGQVGGGVFVDSFVPVWQPFIDDSVVDIAAGGFHSLALKNDGSLWSWGRNAQGQLGRHTDTSSSPVPSQASVSSVVAMSAGGLFSVATTLDGRVWAWGSNDHGQLAISGGAGVSSISSPQLVKGVAGITAVAGGWAHTLAAAIPTMSMWGGEALGELGNGTWFQKQTFPTHVVGPTWPIALATGRFFSLAVSSDRSVWSWGLDGTKNVPQNPVGALGNGCSSFLPPNYAFSPFAVRVQKQGGGFLTGISAVAAGTFHGLALQQDGRVWAWGSGGYGQIGDNAQNIHCVATDIGLRSVKAVAAGSVSSFAIKSDGTLWGWGDNFYGELGIGQLPGTLVPVQVPINGKVVAISSGVTHTLAITDDGAVWAWGVNYAGELGDGCSFWNWNCSSSYVPKQISLPGVKFVAVAAFGWDEGIWNPSYPGSMALDSKGNVWVWGDNAMSQLANKCSAIPCWSSVPTTVSGLPPIAVIGGGVGHRLAAGQDGSLWAWGDNGYGQLGNLSFTNSSTPLQVLKSSHVMIPVGGLGGNTLATFPTPSSP
jgi:alpha-tubulin suppressor-like RCC1 family protein